MRLDKLGLNRCFHIDFVHQDSDTAESTVRLAESRFHHCVITPYVAMHTHNMPIEALARCIGASQLVNCQRSNEQKFSYIVGYALYIIMNINFMIYKLRTILFSTRNQKWLPCKKYNKDERNGHGKIAYLWLY